MGNFYFIFYFIHEVRYYQEYLQSSYFQYDFYFESFYFYPKVNKKKSKRKNQWFKSSLL